LVSGWLLFPYFTTSEGYDEAFIAIVVQHGKNFALNIENTSVFITGIAGYVP